MWGCRGWGWAITATTLTSVIITRAAWSAAVVTITTWGWAVISTFLLVHPALDTDHTVNGAGFGESILNGNTKGLKWHLAFAVYLRTGDVSTTETTCNAETDAFSTEFHGGLHGALHGAAERNTTLKLNGDLLGNELGIKLRLANLDDVDLHLSILTNFAEVSGHTLDLRTLTTDDETRT